MPDTMDGLKSAIVVFFLLSSFQEEVLSVGEPNHQIQVLDRILKDAAATGEEHDQRFDAYWLGFSDRRLRSKRRQSPPMVPPTSNGRVSWGAPPAYRYKSPPPPVPSQPMPPPSPPSLPQLPPGQRLL